jgi:hypothetical protein
MRARGRERRDDFHDETLVGRLMVYLRKAATGA